MAATSSNQPLVSIIVITYNSAEYVIETLESAKYQTYDNIELIVSDDASVDNTVEVCRNWVENNKIRFLQTKIVTASFNKGVAANCNNGLYHAQGDWIKIIAGDDILLTTCIQDFVDFVHAKDCMFVFSLSDFHMHPKDSALKMQKKDFYRNNGFFFKFKPVSQFLYLLIHDLVMNPVTFFCNREALLELNGFDERYACEDLPLYIRVTFRGHQLALLEKETVIYRVHNASQSFIGQEGLINLFWFKEYYKIRKPYIQFSLFLKHPLVFFEFHVQYFAKYLISKLGNKKSYKRILQMMRMISPIYCREMLEPKFHRHFKTWSDRWK